MTTPFDALMVDEYALDNASDWQTLAAAGPPWSFATLKVSQGLGYSSGDWFTKNWQALAATSLIRGAYCYLEFAQPGKAQAEFFLKIVANAGGFRKGDLWPCLDVESADNPNASKAQVEDCTSEAAETIANETGMKVMLYGHQLPLSLGITSHMGCSVLWIADYAAKLYASSYEEIGWTVDELGFWQYKESGGPTYLRTPSGVLYPSTTPGCGSEDLSVLTYPGGLAGITAALEA